MIAVQLAVNERVVGHLRRLEARAGEPGTLSATMGHEIGRPQRAVYLGVYGEQGLLLGCARVVPQLHDAVLLDDFTVLAEHPQRAGVEEALLEGAHALAVESGKPLGVIADDAARPRWQALGFRPNPRAWLTLA
jgi:hypothetical protein